MTEMFKDERIYGVKNKVTNKVWAAPSGKYKWFREQDCKNAWHTQGIGYFREQNEYEIIEFKFIRVDKKEEMDNKYYRKRLGLS